MSNADTGLPPPPPSCKVDGYACVAEAPSGWDGPFALFDGLAASAPQCTNSAPSLKANADLVPAPAAACGACTCTAQNATCSGVHVDGAKGNCQSCAQNFGSLAPGVCYNYSYGTLICDGFNAGAFYFGTSTVAKGTCTPDVAKPTPMKTAVQWNRVELGCQVFAAKVDCDSGFVCQPVPKPPFAKGMCIQKQGDLPACPGAPYTQRFLFYQSANDTRDCGACGCGMAPDPLACTATVTTSTTDGTCQTGTVINSLPGCSADYPGYAKLDAKPPAKPTCPANGGAPTGSVTPSNPVTVCCMP